jgi:hypothetical protein
VEVAVEVVSGAGGAAVAGIVPFVAGVAGTRFAGAVAIDDANFKES